MNYLIILLFLIMSQLSFAQKKVQLFVSTDGSDDNSGSINKPFATITKAMEAVRYLKMNKTISKVEVVLRKGTYYLTNTLKFTQEDGGSANTTITYLGYENERVIISGGMELKNWENDNGIWKHHLPTAKVNDGSFYFRQLFSIYTDTNKGNKRLQRATLYNKINKEYFYTKGPLLEFKSKIKKWDFEGVTQLRRKDPAALCGFSYQNEDIKLWDDYQQAEILTHHSWESSWQTIKSVDTARKEVYFNSPSAWPIAFFGNGAENARYRVENIRAALDEPGEWMIDRNNATLLYIPKSEDSINSFSTIAPILNKLLVIEGTKDAPIHNLYFRNITFSHAAYSLGQYVQSVHQRDIQPPFTSLFYDWPQHAKNIYGDWPTDFLPGYSEIQAAIHCGQAIELSNTQNCGFSNCVFTGMGSYAIKIGESCKNITVIRNTFTDLGGGAILIGEGIDVPAKANFPLSATPSYIVFSDNLIFETGKIFYGSVAVFLGQTHHNKIIFNEIHDLPYSGISMGWTWGNNDNYVTDNLIANNHIHHICKVLTDGGGIYTLGKIKNCIISSNHIHDVIHQEGALGSGNGGMFFDNGSADAIIKDNVIYYISDAAIKFNDTDTDPKKLTFQNNFIEIKPYQPLFPSSIWQQTGIRTIKRSTLK